MATYTKMYAQLDPRWSKLLLGFNSDPVFNIGNYGCLATAVGNMLWWITGDAGYTPAMINEWLKTHGGYQAGGGTMIWGAILGLGHIEAHGATSDLAQVQEWLKDRANYAILEVRAGARHNLQHFVMAPLTNEIIDSEDGNLKPVNVYPFVGAHLYRATGQSPVPVSSPPVSNQGDSPMTGPEETQAYQIVLRRNPDGPVPDGRSGFQFILDAQGELEQQRQAEAAQIAAAQQAVEAANARALDLTTQNSVLANENARLNGLLNTVPAAAPVDTISAPPAADFRATEVPYSAVLYAKRPGIVVDYAGVQANMTVVPNMKFTIESKFVVDGKVYYRTVNSVTNNHWYGVDPALFAPTSSVQSLSLFGSQIYGLIKRAEVNLLRIAKPTKGK